MAVDLQKDCLSTKEHLMFLYELGHKVTGDVLKANYDSWEQLKQIDAVVRFELCNSSADACAVRRAGQAK
mgnify:CR=1 FL=1